MPHPWCSAGKPMTSAAIRSRPVAESRNATSSESPFRWAARLSRVVASSTLRSGIVSTMNDPYHGYSRDETPANSVGAVAKISIAVDVSTQARRLPCPAVPMPSKTRSRFSIASRIVRPAAAADDRGLDPDRVPGQPQCPGLFAEFGADGAGHLDQQVGVGADRQRVLGDEYGQNTFAVAGSRRAREPGPRARCVSCPTPCVPTSSVWGREPSRADDLMRCGQCCQQIWCARPSAHRGRPRTSPTA